MSSPQQLWIGYTAGGRRLVVDVGVPGSNVLLLGSRSGDLAALAALSAKEAGARPVILDLSGAVSKAMSGYFDTYDYRSFLYDSFRLVEPGAWHSQLAAAAYAVALDLTSEEEAIVNAAMQVVASEGTLLSPVSLHDVMGKVEGFRGFYLDRLNGRIGSLHFFDATDDQSFNRLVDGNVLVDFHSAPYPQAGELAAALFLAKYLAISHSTGATDGFIFITDAHRIFRATPRLAHSNRLLSHLFEGTRSTVFSSGQHQSLNPLLLQSCPARLYSSDAWHSETNRAERLMRGTFMFYDRRSESREPFVPRRASTKTAEYTAAAAGKFASPELNRRILEETERFSLATPESIMNYIAPDYLPSDIRSALAGLERQGCLILEPKESGSGPKVFSYTLSERGRSLLKELRS